MNGSTSDQLYISNIYAVVINRETTQTVRYLKTPPKYVAKIETNEQIFSWNIKPTKPRIAFTFLK